MKQQPNISIITINYNGLQETCQLIESLQQHPQKCSYELIVVDNGSTQNEAIFLQEKYPYIQTVRSERNLGFAGGNNLGIRAANGKCIFLLNNDTIILDDSLIHLYETLNSSPEIGAISPKIKFAFPPQNIQFAGFTPFSKYTLRNQCLGYNEPDKGQFNTPRATNFLHGAAMIVKREVIETIGLMPEIYFLYYEEMDWCTQMLNHGYQLWYEPQCTVFHKESCSTGKNSPLKTFYLTRNRLLYTWRNKRGYELFISLIYLFVIANPKKLIINIFKLNLAQCNALVKGCISFIFVKNKRL